MFKMTRWFLWGLFLLLLIAAVDQVLLRVELPVPGYAATQEFYVDFRSRLFQLAGQESSPASPSVSAQLEKSTAVDKAKKPKGKRYLYADGDGALQFADSLEEVPLQYRKDAQPLAE